LLSLQKLRFMAKNYFKRYIWIIELLQSYSMLTLDEIKYFWMKSNVNDEHKPLADRTFFNNIDAIRDMFGIDIVCNRSTNEYYIENEEDIKGSGIRNWMMNALSMNNLLTESSSMKDRILFEDIPSSQRFLMPIMKAIKDCHKIKVRYKSFAKDSEDERTLNPYCVKSYKQRWYLLASTDENPEPHIYALDRMLEVKQSAFEWTVPEDFNAEEYFAPYCGYPTGNEKYDAPVTVKLKVSAHQANYFRTLPLHNSQKEEQRNEEYSIFTYHLIPNYHFKQLVLSYMDAVEVLEPKRLRQHIRKVLEDSISIYSK